MPSFAKKPVSGLRECFTGRHPSAESTMAGGGTGSPRAEGNPEDRPRERGSPGLQDGHGSLRLPRIPHLHSPCRTDDCTPQRPAEKKKLFTEYFGSGSSPVDKKKQHDETEK